MSEKFLSNELHNLIEKYLLDTLIRFLYLHPVTFELIYEEFPNEILFDDLSDLSDISDEIKEEIMKIGWDTIYCPGITIFRASSSKNGNLNKYGGGCGDLNIPVEEFDYSTYNPKYITLAQVAETIYRLKGSKYDWFCEFIDSVKIDKYMDILTYDINFKYKSL